MNSIIYIQDMSKVNYSISCVGKLEGHNGRVNTIAVTENEKGEVVIVTGGVDKKVLVWEFNPENIDTKEVNSEEELVRRAETLLGKPKKSLSGHNHLVSKVAFPSGNSTNVISASWDKTMRLWDLKTNKSKQIFQGHSKDVLAVTFSADKRMVISGSMDKTMKVWDVEANEKHTSSDSYGWVSSVINVKQGKENYICAASWDNRIRVYDSEFKVVTEYTDIDYPVNSMVSDKDGSFLFAGEKNGTIKIFNLHSENESDQLKESMQVNATELYDVSYNDASYSIIFAATSSGLIAKDLKGKKDIWSSKSLINSSCHCLAWDKQGKYLFGGFKDGSIRVFVASQLDE